MKKIEVILFAGFLGVGKTTLLSRLLPELSKGRETALLVNDFGKLSLDGTLLKRCGVPTLEIAGGSIFCCCKQASLVQQLTTIAEEIQPELLLIEASGLAEPTDTAALLQNTYLRESYALPQVITVVDAVNYPKLSKILRVIDMQIKIADLIIVTKTDLAKTDLTRELHDINPDAPVIYSDKDQLHGKVELKPVPDCTTEAPLRLCPTVTPGFVTVNWEEDIAPENLEKLMEKYKNVLLRAKGVVRGRHLDWVNGECVWSDDVPEGTRGLFFALQGNYRNMPFELDLRSFSGIK